MYSIGNKHHPNAYNKQFYLYFVLNKQLNQNQFPQINKFNPNYRCFTGNNMVQPLTTENIIAIYYCFTGNNTVINKQI